MSHIPDMQRVDAINLMIRRGMIQLLQHQDSFAYKAVQLDTMSKMASLNGDERLVYQQIMNADNEGIWTKTIKIRTNLHQQVVSRCIKTLEQKNLIKSVKSVKNPTRKLYMLIELTPSTEVTGGPWFTDQELDVDFIETLSGQCYKFIYSRSFPRQPADAVFPCNYSGYPSAREISKFISDRQISNVALGMEDIECLLDVLVLDGKIERCTPHGIFPDLMMSDEHDDDNNNSNNNSNNNNNISDTVSSKANRVDWVYRAVRDRQRASGNPWTNTPCGKCPVFSFCTEDGPISPSNCEYYTRWLQF
ncbi:RNA polymerase III subunit Rpc34 [Syncephalis plumigaleata]|nr:RNA polymerase III subunit Rpc34 [Syncephalis plumigaleata]